MPVTDEWKLPYPELADPADVPKDIGALALRLDGLLGSLTQLGETNRPGGSYVLVNSDAGKVIEIPAGTLTVPTNAQQFFRIGAMVIVVQSGAGPVNVNAMAGVSVVSLNGYTRLAGTWAVAVLIKTSTDGWVLSGQLVAEPTPPPPPPTGGFMFFDAYEVPDGGGGWYSGRITAPGHGARWSANFRWSRVMPPKSAVPVPSNPNPANYQMQIQAGGNENQRMEGGTAGNVEYVQMRINNSVEYDVWANGSPTWGPSRFGPVINVNGGEGIELCRWCTIPGMNTNFFLGVGVYYDFVPRNLLRDGEPPVDEQQAPPTKTTTTRRRTTR